MKVSESKDKSKKPVGGFVTDSGENLPPQKPKSSSPPAIPLNKKKKK